MTRIGIIGGHGKVAMLAAPLLVEAGDDVVSIIRNPDQVADVEATGAQALVKDVMTMSTEQMAELFTERNLDAIVWSAGVGGGDAERTYRVDRDAAIRSMDAAQAAGVQRYVMVSYLGASLDHGVPEDDDFYAYAQSKAEADEHLRGTDLDWTLLGPPRLTEKDPSGRIVVTTDREQAAEVSRANVARVVAAVLADASTVRKAIPFADGDTEIVEAVAAAPAGTSLVAGSDA